METPAKRSLPLYKCATFDALDIMRQIDAALSFAEYYHVIPAVALAPQTQVALTNYHISRPKSVKLIAFSTSFLEQTKWLTVLIDERMVCE